jgi:hypothetical protein
LGGAGAGGSSVLGGAGGAGGAAAGGAGGIAASGGEAGSAGLGGAAGDGGSATGGSGGKGSGGAGGSAGATGCDLDPSLVDDMHSADSAILLCSGRVGRWYRFGPDQDLTFAKVAVSEVDASSIPSKYEAKLTGSTTQSGDCGMGFPLADNGLGKSAYSLAGKGITFKYRSSGIAATATLLLAVPILATTPASQGGTCDIDCFNHYAHALSVNGTGADSNGWVSVSVPFVASSAGNGFAQNAGWGKGLVDWKPETALMIQFAVSSQGAPYTLEVGPVKLVDM